MAKKKSVPRKTKQVKTSVSTKVEKPKQKSVVGSLAWILLIIGGLNWGVVGLLGYDLVDLIFPWQIVANIIYLLVGLSAIYGIFACRKHC